ncbi:Phenylalanyl-tRNA synthetase beta subunit [Operophtera brumata]|uniref:Phenylalanyl-tRNA synthetase beta subunit n=1 Tax=Operophtera brumata TaxID=104452 RepID=A0A0L7L8U3_OPEBR|nr:Phenylalanyl-tRNA synthetase beta subunit [Operophtera brumata]
MPTVSVKRDALFKALGKTYTDDEFQDLCFEFGLELDEVTTEKQMLMKEQGDTAGAGVSEEILYRIDIPANRYDLLKAPPEYKLTKYEDSHSLHLTPATAQIRPYAVAAVLRGVTFTKESYDSFIDLQCKVYAPDGSYELYPKLTCREELVSVDKANSYIGIRYEEPYTVEQCKVYAPDGSYELYPKLTCREELVSVDKANSYIGIRYEEPYTVEQCKVYAPDGSYELYPKLTESGEKLAALLSRMCLSATLEDGSLRVRIPPTRHDVIHACDAYNRIEKRSMPLATAGAQEPRNKLTEQLRQSCAHAGYTEALTFTLVSTHALSMPLATAGAQEPRNKLTEQLRQSCAHVGYTEALTFTLIDAARDGGRAGAAQQADGAAEAELRARGLHGGAHFHTREYTRVVRRTRTIRSMPLATAGAQEPRNKLTEQLRQSCAHVGYTEALTFTLVSTHALYDVLVQLDRCRSRRRARRSRATS